MLTSNVAELKSYRLTAVNEAVSGVTNQLRFSTVM